MAAFDVNGGVSCRAKSQRDKDFNAGYEQGFAQGVKQTSESLANCHQSEIGALKAQVEELNGKLMLAEIRAERADIDHARQLAYWKIIVKHNLCEEVDKSIQQQKGE